VVSLRSMTSDSLINVADRYVDLDQIKEEIQKTSKHHVGYNNFPVSVLDQDRSSR